MEYTENLPTTNHHYAHTKHYTYAMHVLYVHRASCDFQFEFLSLIFFFSHWLWMNVIHKIQKDFQPSFIHFGSGIEKWKMNDFVFTNVLRLKNLQICRRNWGPYLYFLWLLYRELIHWYKTRLFVQPHCSATQSYGFSYFWNWNDDGKRQI